MIGDFLYKRKSRNGRESRESRKSRNGLRPRPDMPDIPGHADKGREERTHNYIYIDNGKRDIF